MRYYAVKLDKKKNKEAIEQITALDRAVLQRAKRVRGSDIMSLIGAGKPYMDQYGTKTWASTPKVLASVKKLVRIGALEERGR